MNIFLRRYQLCALVLVFAVFAAAGCTAGPEPAAPTAGPTATPEVVVLVVTATEAPPTPTPEVVFVVVTATSEPAIPEAEEEVPVPATATKTATPEPVINTSEAEVEPVAQADEASSAPDVDVRMSLSSRKTTTQHSPRPEPFVEPESVEALRPPMRWVDIQPDQSTEFQSYDGIRVLEGGEAVLDLGDLMRLILKHDSELQTVPGTLVQEELDQIQVDFQKSPLLQQVVLAAHLFRGGFLGEKTLGSEPVALTTPNAVIIVSGTTFFLVHDPDAGITFVGNFDGTIDVADVALQAGEGLPDRQFIAIPSVRGQRNWPLHPHMNLAEFSRLVDLLASPLAAADMISGPYLRVVYSPDIAVRNGPGTEFTYVGTLANGDYARIIGRGRGWWQIACPPGMRANACWISGGSAFTEAFNLDIAPVPLTAQSASPTPSPTVPPTPTAVVGVTVNAPVPPGTSPGDVYNCRYIGGDKFEWYTDAGGPFTGIWQSGCPASPKITLNGCTVSWDAGNPNVKSAVIRIAKKGTRGYDYSGDHEAYENVEQFAATLPDGSKSFELPYWFEGNVTASFEMTLDNGTSDLKKTSRSYYKACYAGADTSGMGPRQGILAMLTLLASTTVVAVVTGYRFRIDRNVERSG